MNTGGGNSVRMQYFVESNVQMSLNTVYPSSNSEVLNAVSGYSLYSDDAELMLMLFRRTS